MIPTDPDYEPSENSQLANDIMMSVEDLAEDLERSDETADNEDMAAMGLPPIGLEQVMGMLGPAIAKKATRRPERAKRALALIHLESGALLEEHTDERPEELL